MDFKTTSLGECLDNPAAVAVVEKYAPKLLKTPGLKLMRKKSLEDIFGLVKSVDQETKMKIRTEIEAI